ncbi:MAG: hypothetical protein ACOCRX_04545 [Candidatus Woesearchaeota archaeon]
MYLVAVIVIAIFFFWILFDIYKHLLKSGKYELIKHEHSLIDFFWILFFGKEFPLKKEKDYEVDIKKSDKEVKSNISDNKDLDNNNDNKKDSVDFNKEAIIQKKNSVNLKKNKLDVNKNQISNNKIKKFNKFEKVDNKLKSIKKLKDKKSEDDGNMKNDSLENKEESLNNSRYLIKKIAHEIKKIKNILENDMSGDFHPGFYYNDHEINNLLDLSNTILNMPESDFNKHVTNNKNDFLNWISDVLEDEELVRKISSLKDKEELSRQIKVRHYYFVFLKKIIKKAKDKISHFKENNDLSKDMGLIDLVYDLEISPFEYEDFLSEVDAIIQYLELAKLQKLKEERIDQSILNMGFNRILIDLSKKIFNQE